MQEKAELKKQVIILGVVLVIVIIFAVILNMNNSNKSNTQSNTSANESSNSSSVQTKDEMLNNLKGLIEKETGQTELKTDGAETTKTSSNETIRYKETEFENY